MNADNLALVTPLMRLELLVNRGLKSRSGDFNRVRRKIGASAGGWG